MSITPSNDALPGGKRLAPIRRALFGNAHGDARTREGRAMRRRPVLGALIVAVLVGAVGLGGSIAAAGQEATAAASTGHPLVGTWIVDPEFDDLTNPPSFDVYMADGTAINIGSEGATAGAWEATGPRTASLTFTGLLRGTEPATVFILRADIEVDEAGERFTGTHSFTVVAPDGTVLAAFQGGTARGTRLHAEPMAAGGESLPGLPTWTPATPSAATPTS